jgi:hypothetical protein
MEMAAVQGFAVWPPTIQVLGIGLLQPKQQVQYHHATTNQEGTKQTTTAMMEEEDSIDQHETTGDYPSVANYGMSGTIESIGLLHYSNQPQNRLYLSTSLFISLCRFTKC